jgi:hypothetical protein
VDASGIKFNLSMLMQQVLETACLYILADRCRYNIVVEVGEEASSTNFEDDR